MKKLFFLLLTTIVFNAYSSSFTPGNIVVIRLGDGSSALTNASSAVFLDEYSSTGTLVQSIAVPTSASGGNHILTMSGTATSEGSLTLSVNGQYLVLTGYDVAPGLASVSSDSTINRTIARVDATGSLNTTTGVAPLTAYKKNNMRGAVTVDGTAFWCSGSGSSNTGGTYYVPFGSVTSSPVQVSSTISSTRVINIFGNQLYASSGSSSYHGVNSVGSGLPVTSGQTSVNLAGMPAADTSYSTYGFYFLDLNPNVPGVDVVYVCDDHTSANGGLFKYSLVGNSWVSNGNIASSIGLRGITAAKTCSAVKIYVTGETGVFGLVDASGYNQPLTGTLTQLVTAGTNTKVRGIAFAPGTSGTSGLTASVSSTTNVSCAGGNNGAITINVTGATGTASYNWGGGVTTQNRNNLAPGTYIVTVTDLAGCTDTASATITQPNALTASTTPANILCNGGSNGSINVTVGGGTPNYSYNWGGGVTTQNRNNIIAGTYIVTVTDSKSCTVTASSTITQPNAISITGALTNLPCSGGSTGAIDVTVTGGNSGYTYSWSNNAVTQDINSVAAGNYSLTVTDANSCTATSTFTLSQSGSLTVVPTVTNISCHGGNNGAVNIAVSGGTPNYTYGWSNSSSNQNQTGLIAGGYTVTVTDNGGCTLVNTFTVTEPAVLAVASNITNASCYNSTNGAIDITVSGGTSSYTYNWGGGIATEDRNNLSAGAYTVTITDAHSCTATATSTITHPDSLSLTLTPVNASSFGVNDGSVTLTVTGGTSPVNSYNWSNGSGTQNISNVGAGNYCVTVTDANSCTAAKCSNVGQPSGIEEGEVIQFFKTYFTNDVISVRAQLQQTTNCKVEVFDITGKLLQQQTENSDYLNLEIPANNLASGCAFVRIITEKGFVTRRVMIVR